MVMGHDSMTSGGAHVLVFPYPARGHIIPLLDLVHQLVAHSHQHGGLTVTVLVTPQNRPLLEPLLSRNTSSSTITPLVLPFPANTSIPAGVENVKDLPPNSFRVMMIALAGLYHPLLHWFQTHPSPPGAIISDMFLGWTHRLAVRLKIRRIVFSPSGAFALSVIYSLWRDSPKIEDPNDADCALISFPRIPNSPIYPWWQLSPIYRSNVEGDSYTELIKDGFLADVASWGLVINSFGELERAYLGHLMAELGHDRVWAVGPLLPPDHVDDLGRGGSSSVVSGDVFSWLDTCKDHEVVYVCFGSQAVLTNKQMEALASGLEESGARFLWAMKRPPTVGHVEGDYGAIPPGFEDRVAGRGLIVKGWAPQVPILRHRAVGAFLTHCGWNSVMEAVVVGLPMLAWPMGADQFTNATLLVDVLRAGRRVCEGSRTVPDSVELARAVAESVGAEERWYRAKELQKAAWDANAEGGSSIRDLGELVRQLTELSLQGSC